VHPLEIPLTQALRVISKWGSGAKDPVTSAKNIVTVICLAWRVYLPGIDQYAANECSLLSPQPRMLRPHAYGKSPSFASISSSRLSAADRKPPYPAGKHDRREQSCRGKCSGELAAWLMIVAASRDDNFRWTLVPLFTRFYATKSRSITREFQQKVPCSIGSLREG
jgi:hypothetical protein